MKLDGSSTDGGMSVTLNSKASEGLHKLRALQTATKHRIVGQGLKTKTIPLQRPAAVALFTAWEEVLQTIELEATTTLKEFVEKINDAGLVNASIKKRRFGTQPLSSRPHFARAEPKTKL